MPILHSSDYAPPVLFRNGHVHTIYSGKFRSVPRPTYRRERITTPDGDFIDLDWLDSQSESLVILLHGLEGSSDRAYVRGMARALCGRGYDVCVFNFRSCSGEMNRLARSYHSGDTDDLRLVIEAVSGHYQDILGVGFSLGGNLLLKYLGEEGDRSRIQRAAAISVPCDLKGSSEQLARGVNKLYMLNFLRSLRPKMEAKSVAFPTVVRMNDFGSIKTFRQFDDRYTAPLHGFRDAEQYWGICSCRQYLKQVSVPTLMLSALDDPFLSESCYPEDEARANAHLHLELPRYGGHVGFCGGNNYWSEQKVVAFLDRSRP